MPEPKGGGSVVPKDAMSVKEVSRYLVMDEQAVSRMARERTIPAVEVDGEWVFSKKSIQKWRLNREQKRQ